MSEQKKKRGRRSGDARDLIAAAREEFEPVTGPGLEHAVADGRYYRSHLPYCHPTSLSRLVGMEYHADRAEMETSRYHVASQDGITGRSSSSQRH
jgi:hypothetical protein